MKYLIFFLFIQNLSAITFKIDYTYDTSNFFGDPNNPSDELKERRDAIEAVAEFFSELIKDEFLQIDNTDFSTNFTWTPRIFHPATGVLFTLPENTVIAANEVRVFVGARDLSGSTLGSAGPGGFSQASGNQAWFDRIRMRGQASQTTDFAPWGGSISFDSPTNWNFSLERNQTGIEFITVALHEFCHILGIGTSSSWENLITESDEFIGAAVVQSFGGMPPVQASGTSGGHGHFESLSNNNPLISSSYGSFGANHGANQRVVMLSSLSDTGNTFSSMSDMDLAALIDIGWEVQVPVSFDSFSISGSIASFQLPTSSFVNYQLRRSIDLNSFSNQGAEFEGDGSVVVLEDSSVPPNRAFYKVEATPIFSTIGSESTQAALQLELLDFEDIEPEEMQSIEGKIYWPVSDCNCASSEHE